MIAVDHIIRQLGRAEAPGRCRGRRRRDPRLSVLSQWAFGILFGEAQLSIGSTDLTLREQGISQRGRCLRPAPVFKLVQDGWFYRSKGRRRTEANRAILYMGMESAAAPPNARLQPGGLRANS